MSAVLPGPDAVIAFRQSPMKIEELLEVPVESLAREALIMRIQE